MRQEWSTEDLIGSWTLVGSDWQRVGNKTGATRLGFGLLLKFSELEARFPRGPEEFPPAVVSYMAEQFEGRSCRVRRVPVVGPVGEVSPRADPRGVRLP
ncbi:DUF4158 domain-containing protein [Nocardia sp. NBC_00881]|uniref:DUF4158 domain-containing protein n=1 Tax=Nocardia sp. NBC_00881 TaxID=2975995 RepID=UPI0038696159